MDNKVTVFNISNPEEDPSAKKKTVGTHTNFMSCCLFPNSDQQVVYSFIWGTEKKSREEKEFLYYHSVWIVMGEKKKFLLLLIIMNVWYVSFAWKIC